jgi:hypothetical protein
VQPIRKRVDYASLRSDEQTIPMKTDKIAHNRFQTKKLATATKKRYYRLEQQMLNEIENNRNVDSHSLG